MIDGVARLPDRLQPRLDRLGLGAAEGLAFLVDDAAEILGVVDELPELASLTLA